MARPSESIAAGARGGGRRSAKRMPAAERRRQLQSVAIEVFAERGYRGASMAEVAERAGVTKPVIYRHFGSKKDLYLEIMDEAAERLLSRVWGGVEGGGDPFQAARRGFLAYFAFISRYADAFHLLQTEAFEEVEIREKLESLRNKVIERIAKFFAQARTGLPPADRRVAATCIVGIAELAGRHLILNQGEDPGRVADVAASLLVGGLDDLMHRFGDQADSRRG
jgi:AcrR family transcriptional regulator